MAKPECINIHICPTTHVLISDNLPVRKSCFCPTTHVLISDNLPVRKSYFNSNIIARILRCFFSTDYFEATSTEAHVYMRRHQGAKVEYFDVNNTIYHKFSHGTVSYTLNGENVNVMLELALAHYCEQDLCWLTISKTVS